MNGEALYLAAWATYFVNLGLSRFLARRSSGLLQNHDLVKISEARSPYTPMVIYGPFALIVACMAAGAFDSLFAVILACVGMPVLLFFGFASHVVVVKKLKQLRITPAYVRQFALQSLMVQALNVVAVSFGIVSMFVGA
jgi:hypothetical protein